MVPEMGSGHRAGGADLASGVDTAGTRSRRAVDRFTARVRAAVPLRLPPPPPPTLAGSAPPRAPVEARPPWHFDFFPLCLPPLAYRPPPLSEVLAATPRSETTTPKVLYK